MLAPAVVTHSPSAVLQVAVPLFVRIPRTMAIGMTRMIRNAVVTRFSCSGWSMANRAGYGSLAGARWRRPDGGGGGGAEGWWAVTSTWSVSFCSVTTSMVGHLDRRSTRAGRLIRDRPLGRVAQCPRTYDDVPGTIAYVGRGGGALTSTARADTVAAISTPRVNRGHASSLLCRLLRSSGGSLLMVIS